MEDGNNNLVIKGIPYFELVPEWFLLSQSHVGPFFPGPDFGPLALPFPEYQCNDFGEKEGTVVLYPGQFTPPPTPKKSILGELILRQLKVD